MRAKAWQLALLLYGPVIIIWVLVPKVPSEQQWLEFLRTMAVFWSILLTFLWVWTVGRSLAANQQGRRDRFFQVGSIVTAIVILIYMMAIIADKWEWDSKEWSKQAVELATAFFAILSVTGLFSSTYMIGYTAKRIAETEAPLHKVWFIDYVGTMFAIWFFPIGVWFLQSRVSKFARGED